MKQGVDKGTLSENHQSAVVLDTDISKNQLGDIISQDLQSKKFEDMTKEEKDQYIKNFYFPFITKLDDIDIVLRRSGQGGEQLVNEILESNIQKTRRDIWLEANYALTAIDRDCISLTTKGDKERFLLQYLRLFLSIQAYLDDEFKEKPMILTSSAGSHKRCKICNKSVHLFKFYEPKEPMAGQCPGCGTQTIPYKSSYALMFED